MTKNFKILKDFNVVKTGNEEIKNKIEKIEDFVLNNQNLEYVNSEAGLILEMIVRQEFNLGEAKSNYELIRKLIEVKGVPTKVANAFYSINRARNEGVHANKKSDKPYSLKVDIISAIELLKKIFIIVKYFVNEHNSNFQNYYEGSNDYNFNSKIYLEPLNASVNGKAIDQNTYRIETKLVSVFDLLLAKANFLIPTYQREYNWPISSIETFLDDIKQRSIAC